MSTNLYTWAETMREHVLVAHLDLEDRAYRATLTPQQLRDYRLFNGELAEQCPVCGATEVTMDHDEFPDMVGTTVVAIYTCCGATEGYNTALVYRGGKAVDVR